jgi:hypothetical protein
VPLIFSVGLYIQAKGDYNQAIGFGFRLKRVKQGGLDLACLGRKVFPPEVKAAKLIFLGPFWEEKSHPFWSGRMAGWGLLPHLFQPKWPIFRCLVRPLTEHYNDTSALCHAE